MPAAVAPDVHDECLADHLRVQVTVEVGPALADHVGDMQVADPPVAELAHPLPAPGHPVLVAQPALRVTTTARRGSPPRAGPIVSSTGLPAAPTSSGPGPVPSSNWPSTASSVSPALTWAPGAASGERARGSEDSPGSTRLTVHRPSPSRARSAPSRPTSAS